MAPPEQPTTRRSILRGLALLAPALGLSQDRLLALGASVHQHLQSAALDPHRWRLFEVDQRDLLAALMDVILPETDSPSASQAGVVSFCDVLVSEWFPPPAREYFVQRLDEFAVSVAAERGMAFPQLGEAARVEVVAALEEEAFALRGDRGMSTAPAALHEQHFFDLLKWMTIFGFYTSEAGMTQERGYRIVPGRYRPDVPYDGVG